MAFSLLGTFVGTIQLVNYSWNFINTGTDIRYDYDHAILGEFSVRLSVRYRFCDVQLNYFTGFAINSRTD